MNVERGKYETTVKQFLAIAGVIVFYWGVQSCSSIHLLAPLLNLPQTYGAHGAGLFEFQFWKFILGMIMITILSRGHLWIYGINSMDVKKSIVILFRFYLYMSLFIALTIGVPLIFEGEKFFAGGRLPLKDFIIWIAYYWMAAPIADAIIFQGVVQTFLSKFWKDNITVASYSIPVVVFLSAASFALGRLTIPAYGALFIEYFLAFGMGIFSGIVYARTRSLLVPMLSQAFFFGMPFVLREGAVFLIK